MCVCVRARARLSTQAEASQSLTAAQASFTLAEERKGAAVVPEMARRRAARLALLDDSDEANDAAAGIGGKGKGLKSRKRSKNP